MALYMYQASYTARSMAAQLNEPQDPVETIRPALEDVGATMLVAGFPFGEYDLLVVYEAPDDMTAASVAMAVAAAGEVKSGRTTRLLSGQEWLESLRKRRIASARKQARASRTATGPQLPELIHSGVRSRVQIRQAFSRHPDTEPASPSAHAATARASPLPDSQPRRIMAAWRRCPARVGPEFGT